MADQNTQPPNGAASETSTGAATEAKDTPLAADVNVKPAESSSVDKPKSVAIAGVTADGLDIKQLLLSLQQENSQLKEAMKTKDERIDKLSRSNVELTKVLNRCGAGGLKLREAMEEREKRIAALNKQVVTSQAKLKDKDTRIGQLETQLRQVIENMAEYVGYMVKTDTETAAKTPRLSSSTNSLSSRPQS
mmetsp:Transcript_10916/g.17870  ORF Transcript_10916/g.17870 Transcript_10916/m.17870 type:complete len:191 (+) Transcript_10916:221-793(+)